MILYSIRKSTNKNGGIEIYASVFYSDTIVNYVVILNRLLTNEFPHDYQIHPIAVCKL